jgi:hypothetical protein
VREAILEATIRVGGEKAYPSTSALQSQIAWLAPRYLSAGQAS